MGVPPKLQTNLFVSSTERKHRVTLHSWLCHLNYSLICLLTLSIQNTGVYCTHKCGTYYKLQPTFLPLLKENIGYITLMGVSPKLQPNLFVSFTYSKQWVTLHSCVCHLNYNPICLLALPVQNNKLYCPHGCGICTYGFNSFHI